MFGLNLRKHIVTSVEDGGRTVQKTIHFTLPIIFGEAPLVLPFALNLSFPSADGKAREWMQLLIPKVQYSIAMDENGAYNLQGDYGGAEYDFGFETVPSDKLEEKLALYQRQGWKKHENLSTAQH